MDKVTFVPTDYRDHFAQWYGTREGEYLALGDPRGEFWIRANGTVVSVEEFNANR